MAARTKTIDLGDQFVSVWELKSVNGSAITGASPTASVSRPDGSTASGTVTELGGGLYRAVYTPPSIGNYVMRWQLTSPGIAADYERFLVVAPRQFD